MTLRFGDKRCGGVAPGGVALYWQNVILIINIAITINYNFDILKHYVKTQVDGPWFPLHSQWVHCLHEPLIFFLFFCLSDSLCFSFFHFSLSSLTCWCSIVYACISGPSGRIFTNQNNQWFHGGNNQQIKIILSCSLILNSWDWAPAQQLQQLHPALH